MLPKYTSNTPGTETQRSAVAELMVMCGTALKMNYSASASGASTSLIATSLKNYFDYDASITGISRSNYREAEWNQLIYDELAAARPVAYSGYPANGDGHAYVIDGYDKDNYFHVNWGWGGYCNGFFLLSVLNPYHPESTTPSEGQYHLNQNAIIGIQKNTGAPYIPELVCSATDEYGESALSKVSRNSVAENFYLMHNMTYSSESTDITYECCTALFNAADTWVANVTGINEISRPGKYGFTDTAIFGANLSDGQYFLRAVYRVKGGTEWKACSKSDEIYINVVISGNTLTAAAVNAEHGTTDKLAASIQTAGEVKVDEKIPLDVTITNNGAFFNSEIYLLVDGIATEGARFEISDTPISRRQPTDTHAEV